MSFPPSADADGVGQDGSSLPPVLADSANNANTPATRPQNAAPMPNKDRPEAVTRKLGVASLSAYIFMSISDGKVYANRFELLERLAGFLRTDPPPRAPLTQLIDLLHTALPTSSSV